MELKDRIAAVRKAAGLTQEQLGELLGVTRQAVSKWESGQTTPDAATIAALCCWERSRGRDRPPPMSRRTPVPAAGGRSPAASVRNAAISCPIIRPVGPNTLSLPPAPALCRARSRLPSW